jgi:hypothetical protein
VIPRTDKERIYQLEGRVGELEQEVAAWKSRASDEEAQIRDHLMIDHVRIKLRASGSGRGLQPAAMLLALLARPGIPLSLAHLFSVTRTPRTTVTEDINRCLVAVRLSHLRKSLDRLGFSGVIVNVPDRGWLISPANSEKIKTSFGL